ncbi:MAG TPA: hypothetical protein VG944_22475 [Fimbriimonas sp.]|nr:hypothetical protein [Fimbriimonas sp.]
MSDANYAPQPKKSKVGLIVTIVVLVLTCCCLIPGIVVVSGGLQLFGSSKGLIGCSISMTDWRDAVMAYAAAHNGKLPPAATWQDDVLKYVKTSNVQPGFPVPQPSDDYCDKQAATVISFNSDLAGKKVDSIKDQEGTVMLFEVAGSGRNKSAKWIERAQESAPKFIMSVPRGWIEIPVRGSAGLRTKQGLQPIGNMRTTVPQSSSTPATKSSDDGS